MVWDLRAALLKKGEFETARLIDFEFRERARTMRLLAAMVSADPQALVSEIVEGDDEMILCRLLERIPELVEERLWRDFAACRAQARRELIAELGDPTPYRLG